MLEYLILTHDKPKGPRIMEAYFKTSDKNISLRIIVAYAPTEHANTEVKNEYYYQLDSVHKNGIKKVTQPCS